ncbi:MAG: TasA family protein [Methanocellales archaeon]|nr:TasA family protein [Methanocellales archaeon]
MGTPKILASIVIIGIIMATVGATMAYFSDVETSGENTLSAGTLDLKIKDQDEYFYRDGVSATWTLSDMKPGDSIDGWVRLRSDGSIAADHLEINVSNVVEDPPGPESDTEENTTDMDKEMIITEMNYTYYTGTVHANCLELLDDTDGDGKISLDELEAQGIDNLPAPPKGRYYTLYMTIMFDPDADNDYQGDILNATFTFTLNQDVSQ